MKDLYEEVQYLKQEVKELKSHILITENIDDNNAEKKIRNLVNDFRVKGKKCISIIDLTYGLHIPMEQANKIMEKLKQEGFVKDGD